MTYGICTLCKGQIQLNPNWFKLKYFVLYINCEFSIYSLVQTFSAPIFLELENFSLNQMISIKFIELSFAIFKF